MKLEVPQDKRLIHTMVVPMRWGDMDALGHVNNTYYFRYMEIARLQWMFDNGVPSNPQGQGQGPVIINAFCNFLRQLEFPGEVLIKTYAGAVGRSSFDTYHEMLRTDEADTVYASGGATVVWVDYARQGSLPLPEAMRALLAG